ncbi:MAG: heme a synthase [Pseudonocardiales bacterium]|nr:heme a synthase [Pseudonocardiales bacterium]
MTGRSAVAAQPASPPAPRRGLRTLTEWFGAPATLRRLALASVIVNIGIVVTGGAVRLTGSGLGCPTWPRCSGGRLVPNDKLGVHGAIEFTNRTLTFLVGVTLLLTLLAAWRQRAHVRLALLALLGVPAQAVLGGLVVLTDLNPWLVAAHFLLSAAIIATTFLLWWRVAAPPAVGVPRPARLLTCVLAGATALVLTAGTVVTGAGPHAGDLTDGKVRRIDLPIGGLAQLHADLVMVLVGLTVGVLAVAAALHAAPLRRVAAALLAVELAQGAVGYTQYFLHVPPVLVGLHMFGACLVWVGALAVLLTANDVRPPA